MIGLSLYLSGCAEIGKAIENNPELWTRVLTMAIMENDLKKSGEACVWLKNNTAYIVDYFANFKSRTQIAPGSSNCIIVKKDLFHTFSVCPAGLSPPDPKCYNQIYFINKHYELIDIF